MDPAVAALLQKLEADVLADVSSLLVPALLAEVKSLSPASAQPIEAAVFAVVEPMLQAALASLIAKVPKP